jgi:hypothetical protein
LATLAHPQKYIFHHPFMSPKNVLGFSPPATHVFLKSLAANSLFVLVSQKPKVAAIFKRDEIAST